MRSIKANRVLGVAVLMAVMIGAPAQAASVTLADIISGGNSISSSDFQFSDFQFSSSLITASDVLVDVGGPLYDIAFSINNLTVLNGASAEVNIAFKVTSLTGMPIDYISLFTNATALQSGSFVLASEVVDPTGEQLTTLRSADDPSNASDSAFLDTPSNMIIVNKDIRLTAGDNGLADLSFIGQNYSVIPTPTASLAGLTLLGLVVARRRRLAA